MAGVVTRGERRLTGGMGGRGVLRTDGALRPWATGRLTASAALAGVYGDKEL